MSMEPPFTKKYFFFDIDGTLASGMTTFVPESTKRTLRLLRERGHFLCIATGRLQADALKVSEEVGIPNLGGDGGNSLTLENHLIRMDSLPRRQIVQLIDELERKGILWAVTMENLRMRRTKYGEFVEQCGDRYFETIVDPDLDYRKVESFYKVYILCSPWQERSIENLRGMPTVRYTPRSVFIEPDNKTIGIKRMMDYMAAPYKDVVVFGDGVNDMKMFLPEWTAIAMGHACPQLKEVADCVTTGILEDGIYNACKHFHWIED